MLPLGWPLLCLMAVAEQWVDTLLLVVSQDLEPFRLWCGGLDLVSKFRGFKTKLRCTKPAEKSDDLCFLRLNTLPHQPLFCYFIMSNRFFLSVVAFSFFLTACGGSGNNSTTQIAYEATPIQEGGGRSGND